MEVKTSASKVIAVEDRTDSERVLVRADDRASLEELINGVELVGYAADQEPDTSLIIFVEPSGGYGLSMTKATFARWLQFEVLNYLTYTDVEER